MTTISGTYRLTRDLPAFRPDKRKRHDWRAQPVRAGVMFRLMPAYYGVSPLAPLRAHTGPWSHHDVPVSEFPEGVLVLVVETPTQWLRREHTELAAARILDTLVARGALTMELIQEVQAWNDENPERPARPARDPEAT